MNCCLEISFFRKPKENVRGLEEVISGFKKKTQEITGKNEKTEKN